MADAQEPAPGAAEPSMEEILASIRKIISDDPETAAASPESDIIELTQAVQDDGSVVDLTSEPTPEEPVAAMPPEPPKVEPVKAPEPPPPPPPLPEPATLVSDTTVGEAATALSSLERTVEIERLAHEPRSTTFIGNGGRTLEDMTIELMRPMLKAWLDENLPGTVERLVQKEIERISKRVKD